MKFLVKKRNEMKFLFGNKTFTDSVKYARIFDSSEEAHQHICEWFADETAFIVIHDFAEIKKNG